MEEVHPRFRLWTDENFIVSSLFWTNHFIIWTKFSDSISKMIFSYYSPLYIHFVFWSSQSLILVIKNRFCFQSVVLVTVKFNKNEKYFQMLLFIYLFIFFNEYINKRIYNNRIDNHFVVSSTCKILSSISFCSIRPPIQVVCSRILSSSTLDVRRVGSHCRWRCTRRSRSAEAPQGRKRRWRRSRRTSYWII